MASLTLRTAGTQSQPVSPTPATASRDPGCAAITPRRSSRAARTTWSDGSDPIAFLDALGEREAILVGHDWGAAIVYGAATFHPERVRAIVPIAIPHPAQLPRNPSTLWGARHFLALKMPWAEGAVRRSDFAYLERLYRRWSPSWAGAARDRSLGAAKRAFTDERSLSGALDYYRALSLRPVAEFARAPDIRGLVVAGTTDLDPRSTKRPPSCWARTPKR